MANNFVGHLYKIFDNVVHKRLLNGAIFLLLFFSQEARSYIPEDQGKFHACDHKIYCQGDLLRTVQMHRIFKDSKEFVDLTMLEDPNVILQEFDDLKKKTGGNPNKTETEQFVKHYFTPEPGHELETYVPKDWIEHPAILERIPDPNMKEFARQMNILWKNLTRKMADDVNISKDRHSLIYMPHPFIIPGERFREFYYWDTYWIVNGLLLCEMRETAKGMIKNLLHIVNTVGMVPNGGRIYYTRRSHPPLLIPMIDSYYNHTKDLKFIRENIETMEKEYMFWMNNRTVDIIQDGKTYKMQQYNVQLGYPRPEGYYEDKQLAKGLNESEEAHLYTSIATACEAGWDFSTRWFSHEGPHKNKFETIRTETIVPVDLNSYLCGNAQTLANFYGLLNNTEKQQHYIERYEAHKKALYEVMWNDTAGAWFDYDLKRDRQRKGFYPVNLVPLLSGCWNGSANLDKTYFVKKALKYLQNKHALDYPGGIPISLIKDAKQQWDFPNGWPPISHLMIEALGYSGVPEAEEIALSLAQTWVTSNWESFKKTGFMYEKYNVTGRGLAGGGGEYTVVRGFGWTNGVVLMLLNHYGQHIFTDHNGSMAIHQHAGTIAAVVTSLVVIIVVVVLVLFIRRRASLNRRRDGGQVLEILGGYHRNGRKACRIFRLICKSVNCIKRNYCI